MYSYGNTFCFPTGVANNKWCNFLLIFLALFHGKRKVLPTNQIWPLHRQLSAIFVKTPISNFVGSYQETQTRCNNRFVRRSPLFIGAHPIFEAHSVQCDDQFYLDIGWISNGFFKPASTQKLKNEKKTIFGIQLAPTTGVIVCAFLVSSNFKTSNNERRRRKKY